MVEIINNNFFILVCASYIPSARRLLLFPWLVECLIQRRKWSHPFMSLSSRVRVWTPCGMNIKVIWIAPQRECIIGVIQSTGASRNSFIPNTTECVQMVQIYTIGIRRKCAFFRSFLSVERRCKVTQIISSSKIFFLLGINKKNREARIARFGPPGCGIRKFV